MFGKITLAFLLLMAASTLGQNKIMPSVLNYNFDIHLLVDDQKMDASAQMTIENKTAGVIDTLPILLYRLLTVKSVTNEDGEPLQFSQDIVTMAEQDNWQVNQVRIVLQKSLQPGEWTSVTLAYSGYICGYPEVMAYTKEHIDTGYTLIRQDIFAYPTISTANYKALATTFDDAYDYHLRVTVPHEYVAACGGRLDSTTIGKDSLIYYFSSKAPDTRVDIAAAKFAILTDTTENLAAYYLPGDSIGARAVLNAMKQSVELYTDWFGSPKGYSGYTVIEIPNGWGSQAGKFYILQTAAAFEDTSRMSEVYHEVGHTWNATVDPSIQRCRYFDEAFASFFQMLVSGELRGKNELADGMDWYRDYYKKRIKNDSLGAATPIAKYGEHELGGYSYTVGAWSLYVLRELIGKKAFNQLVRELVSTYGEKGVNFAAFKQLAESASRRNLARFFDEWIYGTEASQLLVSDATLDEIVARYR